ncbi:CLUMA_CG005931, isoform A [Clunio marinus]|uniref:CLUMA_CG005931, isoform A n=1 Tax=Clunio marinus TaxID=568069 RepID=A0A1J1I1V2_9DIPT|nr:CLUMA_CG005931, isoform A [Clunio marinus]
MDSHQENSFWKNNVKMVPGRPSPTKDFNRSTTVKAKNNTNSNSTTSFEKYQKSVSDAWTLSEDELTKEYCILTDDPKAPRRPNQNNARVHKNPIAVVHRQVSTSSTFINTTNSATTSTANHNIEKFASENNENQQEPQKPEPRKPTSEYGRLRQRFNSYPGRPQLLNVTSLSMRDDAESKLEKFSAILEAELLNLKALKELSWQGVPRKMRAVTWRLLSGYLPTSLERRNSVLERKRIDYQALVKQYFHVDVRDESQQDTFRQIHIDVPRMNPHVPLFQQQLVQEMFERILFIWAIRHPASGYVQGINDLVTPFFIVFLQEQIGASKDLETYRLEELSEEQRNIIEADSFWCISKFLDCIQDNYIFAQLGIQEKVNQLKELIQRIDLTLHKHLQSHGIDYLQFSFRWMNNLLTRELPLYCTIRLWDTYLAESDGFAVFQLYVCAAFLLHWREQLLQERDFQGLMLLLQNLPTHNWLDSHISLLVAEAFRLKFTYADAPKHFEVKSS